MSDTPEHLALPAGFGEDDCAEIMARFPDKIAHIEIHPEARSDDVVIT